MFPREDEMVFGNNGYNFKAVPMTIQQPSFTCFNIQCTEFREAGEEEDDD